MGDFNARPTSWCTATNTHGTGLKIWANRHNLRITTPAQPTFRNKSTPDIVQTKALTVTDITVKPGSGNTGHTLVRMKCSTAHPYDQFRIPRKLLVNEDLLKKAGQHYSSRLPPLTMSVEQCFNCKNFENLVNKVIRTFLHPWRGAFSARPRRFRKGWNHRIDQSAKKRTRRIKR